METAVRRTAMPTAAGILDIVAGAFCILGFLGVIIVFFFIPTSMSFGPGTTQEFGLRSFPILTGIILASAALFMLVFSVLPILGGVYAIQRKKWGLALTGAIVVTIANLLLGVPALILTALAKDEFE